MWVLSICQIGWAAEQTVWRTGPDFQRQLQMSTGLNWKSNPLRQGLYNLAVSQRTAVLLDRRVDPDQKVGFAASDVSLDELFNRLAQQLNIGVCYLDPVVYFGPRSITNKLPTLAALRAEEVRRLSKASQRRFSITRPWRWDDLAEPQDLLQQLAKEYGLDVEGLDRIPHDLWPAVELPRMSFVNRMTLVLVGFDMTFELSDSGTQARLIPISDPVLLERPYSIRGDVRRWANELKTKFPNALFRPEGRQLSVTAVLEDHRQIQRLVHGQREPRRTPRDGQMQVHSLKVEKAKVGGVINAVAMQLKLEVVYTGNSQAKLDELVTFDVKNVSLNVLLEKALQPVGLTFNLENDVLTVSTEE